MRRKLTATLVAKLTVPDGKKSIKLFDTEVAGLGVRKMATGIASFILENRQKGAAAAKIWIQWQRASISPIYSKNLPQKKTNAKAGHD